MYLKILVVVVVYRRGEIMNIKNKKTLSIIAVVALIVVILLSDSQKFGYLNQHSVVNSFTPESICNNIGGNYFTANDRALCNQAGCYVSNDYSFSDTNAFYALVGGSSLLIAGATATGLCGAITPYISWACSAYSTIPLTLAGSIIIASGVSSIAHSLDTTCESCLSDGVITTDGTACCSGYSKELEQDLFNSIIQGEPRLCLPEGMPGATPSINREGILCQIGSPITKWFGLDNCIVGFYYTIGGIIALILLILFMKK